MCRVFHALPLALVMIALGAQSQETATPLPQATPGGLYAVQLGIEVSGVYPFHFSVVGGALPAGLSLADSGLLKGVLPAANEGVYSFAVRVTDTRGTHKDVGFALRVSSEVPVVVAGGMQRSYGQETASRDPQSEVQPVEGRLSYVAPERGEVRAEPGRVTVAANERTVDDSAAADLTEAVQRLAVAPVRTRARDVNSTITAQTAGAPPPPAAGVPPAAPVAPAPAAPVAPAPAAAVAQAPPAPVAPAPVAAVSAPAQFKGSVKEGVTVTITRNATSPNSALSICVLPGKPAKGETDCTKGGVQGVSPSLISLAAAHTKTASVSVPNSAEFPVTLDTALTCGEYVALVVAGTITNATTVCSAQEIRINTVVANGISLIEGVAMPSKKDTKHKDEFTTEVRVELKQCMIHVDKGSTAEDHDPQTECVPAEEVNGKQLVTALTVSDGPKTQDHYVNTDEQGNFTASLQSPIVCEDKAAGGKKAASLVYVSAVQMNENSKDTGASPWVLACDPGTRVDPCLRAFNDCDESFSLVGGIEQSDVSSKNSQTGAFIRAYTRAPQNPTLGGLWGSIRLLSAPTVSDTQNVISVVSDPTGALTTKSFATVGTAVDYLVGYEKDISWLSNQMGGGRYTVGLIFGSGATTPLGSQKLVLAYAVPDANTVECSQLQRRFTPAMGFPLAPSSFPGAAKCLYNTTGVTNPSKDNPGVAINTLGFTNQDRSSFLFKYGVGVRTIDRFHTGKSSVCGPANDVDPEFGPCERGTVDFIVGQDEAITGGYLRKFVFKIDGIHPLPIAGSSILYLFGAAAIRIDRNRNLNPLILKSAAIDQVTVPSAGVFVLPLKQPNRDFYRFGVGLNLNAIFKKLSTATTTPAAKSPKS